MYQFSQYAEKVMLPGAVYRRYVIFKHEGQYYIKPRKAFPSFRSIVIDGEKFVEITKVNNVWTVV